MRMKKFKNSLLTLTLCTALLVALTLSIVSLVSVRVTSKMATTKYETAMNNGYNAEIKSEVESVIAVLQHEYDRIAAGELTEAQAKDEAKEIVRAMRYREDQSGYFWIDATDYTLIMHPILTENEGNNRHELEDQNGVMIIQEIMNVCTSDGGGYNEFYFTKSDGVTVAPKIAYSEIFTPWNWVVSTGNYVDDMNLEMTAARSEISEQFLTLCIIFVISEFILFVLAWFAASRFAKSASGPLVKIQTFAARLASGDLTTAVQLREKNEFGQTAQELNRAQENIHSLIDGITGVSNDLGKTVREYEESFTAMKKFIYSASQAITLVSDNSTTQAQATENAMRNIHLIAEEITDTNQKVGELDTSMKQLGRQSLDTLDELVQVNVQIKEDIGKMSDQTELTNTSVENIKVAAELINGISSQTNLLSLNASIEAARAGELGKGFAVVANEIGNLATQSAAATQQIEQMIGELFSNSSKSMSIMQNMNATVETQVETLNNTQTIFKTLYSNIDTCIDTTASIKEITELMDKQRDDILAALQTLDNLSQSNNGLTNEAVSMTTELSGAVTQASATIAGLSEDVKVLLENVGKFTL